MNEEKLKEELLNTDQGSREYYLALINLKDFYIEQVFKEFQRQMTDFGISAGCIFQISQEVKKQLKEKKKKWEKTLRNPRNV